jgi:5-methylcytosine-specific restriction endonuclease McrA
MYEYNCDTCNNGFEQQRPIRKGRRVRCQECKRKVHNQAISSRTWSKIITRMGCVCSICGWDEASLDLHHIIEQKNGGSDSPDNLIVLCPNCHRKVHCGVILVKELISRTLSILYPNWRDFYQGECKTE